MFLRRFCAAFLLFAESHNCGFVTDNILVENFIVYGLSALFFAAVLPVYVGAYVYVDTGKKYASVSFYVYGAIKFLNINTEDRGRLFVNGKEAGIDPVSAVKNAKITLCNLCVTKIIQLSDFGADSESNAYAALAHSAATLPLYGYLSRVSPFCKLRNYIIFASGHCDINYMAKAVGAINVVSAVKILILLLVRGIYENQR